MSGAFHGGDTQAGLAVLALRRRCDGAPTFDGPSDLWVPENTTADPSTPRHAVTDEDLLVAIPTATFRHNLVYMSRHSWRHGLKTYIASNGTQEDAVLIHGAHLLRDAHLQEAATQIVQAANVSATANATDAPDAAAAQLRSLLAGETPPTERWGTYRDETEPKGPGVKLRYTPGDARMLALVRLANQSFRLVEGPGYSDDTTWKWMLYGDDDIYWFVDNLLPALEELDPDVAYYVTDDIMGCCHGAFKWCTTMATACQPPTRKPVRDVNNTCDLQRPAAPCLQSQLPLDEHAAEGFCAGRQKEVWFNGGRGAAFSRGLLRSITAEQWLECEGPRGPQWGGDNRITGCLSRHDVGPTMLSRSMDTCRFGRIGGRTLLERYQGAERQRQCISPVCREAVLNPISTTVPANLHHGAPEAGRIADLLTLHTQYRTARHILESGPLPPNATATSSSPARPSQPDNPSLTAAPPRHHEGGKGGWSGVQSPSKAAARAAYRDQRAREWDEGRGRAKWTAQHPHPQKPPRRP